MARLRLVCGIFLLVSFCFCADARPIKLARQPDYHSGKIVFTYQGDIWMVNEDGSNARRMTVHTARDTNPRFSPDGKWIAFSSDRYGNADVFVIPSAGGEAKQLTFHSGGDTVVGWSRDSKRVVFSSARGRVFGGTPNLLEVSIDGGLEQPLNTDWGTNGTYSPDGKKFAFNRHPAVWSRKHYRGSYAADLWVMDVAAKTFQKLVDGDTPDDMEPNNFWPMFGNGEIFFVSDRATVAKAGSPEVMKSVNNIWKIPAAGGKPVQVTQHRSGNLYFPSISADGKTIVYEENFGIWKLDTASGRTSEVKIDIASDAKENEFEVITYTSQADSYDLSPSTRRAVISIRGEIFTIATDRGDISRLTHSYKRDTNPVWSPDGKWIAYESDESGQDEVWVMGADGKNPKKLTAADTEKSGLAWSPDSKSVAYSSSDKKLYVADVASGQSRAVASGEASAPQGAEFSPDGKWIAYTKADRDLRPHVWIVAASGGEEHLVSDDGLFASQSPRWTPDGRKLIFLGGYVQGGSATQRNNVAAVYNVSLTKEDRDPVSRDIDDEEAAMAAERAARPAGQRPAAQADAPEVKIDWEGLDRRIRQVTRISDSISTVVPSPDSRTYAFVAQADIDGRNTSILYSIQENGDQLRRVTQSAPPAGDGDGPPGGGGFGGGITSLQFSRDGRAIFFREGQGIWSVPIGGGGDGTAAAGAGGGAGAGGAAQRRRVNFTARVEVDHREERKQVFAEGWRIMKHRFYDPNMHGANWNAARATYEPLLEDVADVEELQNVMMMMIGELNASHTGVTGGGPPDRNPLQTRYPGFELEADASGYYKVSYIYKDGPADRDFVRVKVGDYILAVNDAPLKSGENYWKHYNLAPGRKMSFTVNSKPAMEGAWSIKVEPVNGNGYGNLLYEKWVAERRAIVDKTSGGEVGYLHIRAMNAPSLARFERELSEYRFKKALIIDQRFNGGGGIDQELLRILQQRQYQYTRGRDSVYLTRPQRAYFGPLVVMQNERSASDAEVFPDGFRTLKLGKVVGVNTLGAVIGTGAFQLMNGSNIRTPGTGLWSITGQNLENYGVPPDVYIDNTPDDYLAGRDAQLEKAVEVLKDELRKLGPSKIPGRE